MKYKLMHFIHGMTMGGAETLVKDYCLNTDRNRFDLVLLCLSRCDTPYEQILEDAGVRILYASDEMENLRFCGIRPVDKFYQKLTLLRTVRKIIRTERPDIIHTHLPINYFVSFAAPEKGTKLFHTVHSEPRKLWNQEFWRKVDFRALVYLQKKYGVQFITLHEQMRQEIDQMFHTDNSVVVNNGIDFTRFEHLPPKAQIREELGLPEDALVLGHVGRFAPMKNHLFLVDIFAAVKEKHPNSKLVLIGSGDLQPKCEEKVRQLGLAQDVLFLSNRTDVPRLLAAMDLFVFPSIYEGLPVSLVEAQRAGLRCVISDCLTDRVLISNLVKKVSLDLSAKQWADQILGFEPVVPVYDHLEVWNMKNIVLHLEHLYLR